MRRLFERGNIAHWKSCPIFCFIIPLNQKMITSNKLNMGLSKCSKFGSLINLSVNTLGVKAWIVTDPVLLDQNPIQLYRELLKEREDGGGVGDFFKEGDYFQYFHLRGAIIRGIDDWSRDGYYSNTVYISNNHAYIYQIVLFWELLLLITLPVTQPIFRGIRWS